MADKQTGILTPLKATYAANLPHDIDVLNTALSSLKTAPDAKSARRSLLALSGTAHMLTGSGATFGYPGVSDTARRLEEYCKSVLGKEKTPPMLADLSRLVGDITDSATHGPTEANETGAEAKTEGEAPTILIVDDSASLARYAEIVLEQAGMKPVVVTDPTKVMELLDRVQPDLILLDLQMPGCDGLELAATIRRRDALSHVPIIFLSAERDLLRREAALETGGDDFLEKPVTATDLIDAIKERIKQGRRSSP